MEPLCARDGPGHDRTEHGVGFGPAGSVVDDAEPGDARGAGDVRVVLVFGQECESCVAAVVDAGGDVQPGFDSVVAGHLSWTGLSGGDLIETGTFLTNEAWFDADMIYTSIEGNTVSASNNVHDSGYVGIDSRWGLSGQHALDSIRVTSHVADPSVATVGGLEDCTANLLCS